MGNPRKGKSTIQPETLSENLPRVFHDLYYYLYSNSNIPRAERLGAEMVRIIFSKLDDELNNSGVPNFRSVQGDSNRDIAKRIRALFEETKNRHPGVFEQNDILHLDDASIAHVVRKLESQHLRQAKRDAVAEAFQGFLGSGLRGEKGQFFTPRNVVKLCVQMLDPQPEERIIDPACGSGGFLIECVSRITSRKKSVRDFKNIYGIDKEGDLARICKSYMAIVGNKVTNISCEDSLDIDSWSPDTTEKIRDGSFDIVLTNPPFGSRIPIRDPEILAHYELGHVWSKTKEGSWIMENTIAEKRDPQVIFLERCLKLLRPRGRMAIVLPDGLFGNPGDAYIISFLSRTAQILAIVSLDHVTFLPSTHTKTSILLLEKLEKHQSGEADYKIYMAIANKVGHDKNGKEIFKMNPSADYVLDSNGKRIADDELPQISEKYLAYCKGSSIRYDKLGFLIDFLEVRQRGFALIPNYYEPELKARVTKLLCAADLDAKSVGDLIREDIISLRRGNEIGSRFYGKGNIPFVRTSDLANWEIRSDPAKCIPEAIYESFKKKQDIKEDDILFVSDGTFLIGKSCIVTRNDTKMVIQSHIRSIRCLKPQKLHPYLLLFLLHTKIVQDQISSKTFVQATISTIGQRLFEIILPIPRDAKRKDEIIRAVSEILRMKTEARSRMDSLLLEAAN